MTILHSAQTEYNRLDWQQLEKIHGGEPPDFYREYEIFPDGLVLRREYPRAGMYTDWDRLRIGWRIMGFHPSLD